MWSICSKATLKCYQRWREGKSFELLALTPLECIGVRDRIHCLRRHRQACHGSTKWLGSNWTHPQGCCFHLENWHLESIVVFLLVLNNELLHMWRASIVQKSPRKTVISVARLYFHSDCTLDHLYCASVTLWYYTVAQLIFCWWREGDASL